jgi:hypothetical protein
VIETIHSKGKSKVLTLAQRHLSEKRCASCFYAVILQLKLDCITGKG